MIRDVTNPYGFEPAETIWPAPQFSCDCPTDSIHPKGTWCVRCRLDRCTLPNRGLVWIDDYGSNGPQGARHYCPLNGQPERIIEGGKPSWQGGHG